MYTDFRKYIDNSMLVEVMSAYSDKKFTFKKISAGFENASFIVYENNTEKYVLRIYNAMQFGLHTRDEVNILAEIEFIQYLYKKSLPVPKIHKTKQGNLCTEILINKNQHFAMLSDFIEGEHVKKLSLQKIAAVAKIQARIHLATNKYKANKFRGRSGPLGIQNWLSVEVKTFKPKKQDLNLFNDGIRLFDLLKSKINSSTITNFPKILIHGDLSLNNLKFKGETIAGIFDFDDMRESIVAEDIGTFLIEVLKEGDLHRLRQILETYFNSYAKIHPLSKDEISLSIYYAAQRRLTFKFLKFMGRWDNAKNEDARAFKEALSQINKMISLVE
jgi:Ser/Thr protein kinase RdoA (MazF antagonist)